MLVDEGHHGVAESWQALKAQFPEAKIVNFSATPTRADGQIMEGYTYFYIRGDP
ncbi:DEAD/DEAH box helicase family protein [Zymomonas mobilis]|uniref:DEAD/DEAH box helicase family protein n=1 Tax=Zymomonas mobilis TaxID=542 RepID=UPI00208EBD7D|nr:DEAD/DEAH box helicase family protein [Zymomonas mobilis]